jgi:hypothetical protein
MSHMSMHAMDIFLIRQRLASIVGGTDIEIEIIIDIPRACGRRTQEPVSGHPLHAICIPWHHSRLSRRTPKGARTYHCCHLRKKWSSSSSDGISRTGIYGRETRCSYRVPHKNGGGDGDREDGVIVPHKIGGGDCDCEDGVAIPYNGEGDGDREYGAGRWLTGTPGFENAGMNGV